MSQYPIRLPDEFTRVLSNSRCSRLVYEILEEFSEFIARNEMVFFRHYTDHGPRHIESVLETAAALITTPSWQLFTAEDACVLIIATVLHDAALHLQEPGFLALVSDTKAPASVPELDNSNWHVLWKRYVSEIGRLSQSQLYDTFGVSEPIPSPDLDNPNFWTPLQYSYIGEFIRRHHHRIAHELARNGIPGNSENSHFLARNDSDPLRLFVDLSGLVARSHGMAIRPLLPYLTRHYHLRTFDSAHPVYLMALLRIADYLQLQSGRAPDSVFQVKRIQSPQSRREWKVHESIKDILYDQNADPESVEIIVDPNRTSIDVFIRVQEWLKGIQIELDTSWAVLGEVFGRFREKALGLSIRRIRSNIDDTETFGKDAGFVPQRVSFSAADAELLKLLIKPLYGDRPEIAVRELVQNAVDAVRERIALGERPENPRNADVEVHVRKHDDGKWSLIVEDYGVGMSFDTLANFFLNAGASFRSSMVWKKQFQTDDGKSIVLRSGRFGVGALAAFLLADDPRLVTIKVSTRHVHANTDGGLEFEAELSDRPLTVRYIRRETVGTRIEVITSSPPAFMQRSSSDKNDLVAEWDWYCLDEPRVRRVATSGRELAQNVKLPASVSTSLEDYHWIEPDGYQSVGWTYGNAPALVCNGIVVSKDRKTASPLEESETNLGKTVVSLPSLSVFDPNGKLPLTLDRLRVDFERISFLDDLRADVFRNIGAYLAVCSPCDLKEGRGFDVTQSKELRTHPAIASSIERIPWVLTPHGVSLFDPELISGLGVDHVVEVGDSKDIGFMATNVATNSFAVAVTSRSLWTYFKEKHKPRTIKSAKRGKYQERKELDSVDERRLEMVLQSLKYPERFREMPYDKGPSWRERVSNTFAELIGTKDSQPPIRHFRREFERVLLSIRGNLWGAQEGEDELLVDLTRRLDERLARSENVTSGMMQAYQLLRDAANEVDGGRLTQALKQAADAIDSPHDQGTQMSHREAERIFERARRRLRDREIYSSSRNSLLEEVLHRLDEVLASASHRNENIPILVSGALRFLESVSPRERKNFEIEGDVSAPIIEWQKLSRSTEMRDNWSVVEYEIDQSIQVTSVTSTIARIWREIIGETVIPYSLADRKRQLSHLWNRPDMKRHLQQWELVLINIKSDRK
jgi:molecular chaperone HtpG